MYVDSGVCVRVSGVEKEWFKIDSGVKQDFKYGWGDERINARSKRCENGRDYLFMLMI